MTHAMNGLASAVGKAGRSTRRVLTVAGPSLDAMQGASSQIAVEHDIALVREHDAERQRNMKLACPRDTFCGLGRSVG